MADVKKIETKEAVEEEGEEEKEDSSQIQNDNFLEREVFSLFAKADESSEEEIASKVAPVKQETSVIKKSMRQL